MLALIDGDIVLHRVGYTTDADPEWVAKARTNEMLEGILHETDATEYEVWLSDSAENNFRYQVWSGYKANRKDKVRPVHLDFIKEYLLTEWGARIAYGMEADDALGIGQSPATVICTIDKDLKQVPGLHYNFVKKEFDTVTPEQGLINFYAQFLIGDVSDNIKGCTGIGPVKAAKAIAELGDGPTEEQLFDCVFELYKKQENQKSTEEILEHLLLIGRLLKIKQHEDELLWDFPKSKAIKELIASSILPEEVEHIQYMEHTKHLAAIGS